MAGNKVSNRKILTQGDNIYARKKGERFGVDEVTFDKGARSDYLTGFHKRKLARQKKAQESAKEMERKLRLEERKKIREERKRDIEEKLMELKQLRDNEEELDDASEDESKEVSGSSKTDKTSPASKESATNFASSDEESEDEDENMFSAEEKSGNEEEDEWEGISDGPPKGVLKKHTEIYVLKPDASSSTTVEIEPMDLTGDIRIDPFVQLEKSKEILDASVKRAEKYAQLIRAGKKITKKRKVKFRYLTKGERRSNNAKQRKRKPKPL